VFCGSALTWAGDGAAAGASFVSADDGCMASAKSKQNDPNMGMILFMAISHG